MVRAELESSGLWRDEYAGEKSEWFERTLDLIRQRRQTLPERVHAFVAHALGVLKESGYEEASLTAATIDRDQIENFRPRWETRYLVHPRGANVSKITGALTVIQKR